MKKSVLAYIASLTALRGRTMGHAGAIATTAGESAEKKVEILCEAGGRNCHAAFLFWKRS